MATISGDRDSGYDVYHAGRYRGTFETKTEAYEEVARIDKREEEVYAAFELLPGYTRVLRDGISITRSAYGGTLYSARSDGSGSVHGTKEEVGRQVEAWLAEIDGARWLEAQISEAATAATEEVTASVEPGTRAEIELLVTSDEVLDILGSATRRISAAMGEAAANTIADALKPARDLIAITSGHRHDDAYREWFAVSQFLAHLRGKGIRLAEYAPADEAGGTCLQEIAGMDYEQLLRDYGDVVWRRNRTTEAGH